MEEQKVSLETAKLAKKKGFDERVHYYYSKERAHSYRDPRRHETVYVSEGDYQLTSKRLKNVSKYEDFKYKAPTQTLLKKWLQEKHDIYLEVRLGSRSSHGYGHFGCKVYNLESGLHKYINKPDMKVSQYIKNYTPQEALEEGLKEALTLI